MWPFKRKEKLDSDSEKGKLSTSCVAKTILEDIRKCSVERWIITHTKTAEKFSHPHLKYSLIASTYYKEKTDVAIEGVYCSFLSTFQALEIKEELTRIRKRKEIVEAESRKKAELEKLAVMFPHCVK